MSTVALRKVQGKIAILNLLLLHFQAKIIRNSSNKSAKIGRKVMREVSNHQDLQRHTTTKEMIRLFMGAQLCTIAQLCTKLCIIVLSPYLMKYLDPSNVMGIQLVQNCLLINNFTFTSINKHLVSTIVRLCTELCMIVLWPHLKKYSDPCNLRVSS